MSNRLQIIGAILILGVAAVGGWSATTLFQKTVSIVPGVQGCARLEGSARQIACLADEFVGGATEVAGNTTGPARDKLVIGYVRRVENIAASDQQLAGICHPAMHKLGRREGDLAARANRTPTFPGGSSQLCTAGYVHGLAEGYLSGTPTADVAAVFPKLCHDPAAQSGCAHGIGHALLRAMSERPVIEASTSALDSCGELPGSEDVSDCHDGVYMELAMESRTSISDYTGACNTATSVDRELSCWGYVGLSITTNDVPLAQVPGWCARASLPGHFTCIEGYGRNLGVDRLGMCQSSAKRSSLQRRCIDGAVGLQVGSGHVAKKEASAACRSLGDNALKDYCLTAVERYSRGRARVERHA